MRQSALVALLCVAVAGFQPDGSQDSQRQAPDPVVTLYARDDLRSSFDFRNGREGGRIVDGEILLDDAQIVFDVFQEGMLSFGFTRDERVRIIDLGPAYVPGLERATDHAPKFSVSIFHTLFLSGSQFSYLGATGRILRSKEAGPILDPLPGEGLYHVAPEVGHTYLLRAKHTGVSRSELLVKFQIIDVRPRRSLTMRWARL